jgi:hypothetical protein
VSLDNADTVIEGAPFLARSLREKREPGTRRHFGGPVQRRIGLDREDEIKEKNVLVPYLGDEPVLALPVDRRRVIPRRYCCAFPAVSVPLSVSISSTSFPLLTTTVLNCVRLRPLGVTCQMPVQSEFSV